MMKILKKVDHADFAINVVAVDETGNEGKFKIYYFEDSSGKEVEVFGEDEASERLSK